MPKIDNETETKFAAASICVYAGDKRKAFQEAARRAGKSLSEYMVDAAECGLGSLTKDEMIQLRALAIVKRKSVPDLVREALSLVSASL